MSIQGNQPNPNQPAALVRTEAAVLEALAARLEGPMSTAFAQPLLLPLRRPPPSPPARFSKATSKTA